VGETIASSDELFFLVRDAGGESPAAPGLEMRLAGPSDAPRYARDIGTDSARTFVRRLAVASGCYIVLEGDHIVHATWIGRGPVWTRELDRCVEPPPADAYVYESFTIESARGRGLYPMALRAICAHLGSDAARVWVGVESSNLASLRAVTKAGFEAAAVVAYRRRLGRLVVGTPRALARGTGPTITLRRPAEIEHSPAHDPGGASEASAP
jgi:ribosomal protein S18 acetylase RimI-like enzyme